MIGSVRRSGTGRLGALALAASLAAAAGAWPAPALAQTAEELAAAKKAFVDGQDAFNVGHYEDAIRLFEEAYRLSRSSKLVFNIAQAERKQYAVDAKLERLRRARELYRTYLRLGDDDHLRGLAEKHVADLDGEIAEAERKAAAAAVPAPVATPAAPEPRGVRVELAGSDAPGVRAGKVALSQGRFAEALDQLDAAASAGGNGRAALVELEQLRGIAAAMAGKADLAREAFRRLLALDGSARLRGDLPDLVTQAFLAAVEATRGSPSLALRVEAPASVRPGQPVLVTVRVAADPMRQVHRLRLLHRTAGAPEYATVQVGPSGQVTVPALGAGGGALELYAAAEDEHGNTLVESASAAAPRRVDVIAPVVVATAPAGAAVAPPKESSSHWFLWTLAAVAVSGGVFAIVKSQTGQDDNGIDNGGADPVVDVPLVPAR